MDEDWDPNHWPEPLPYRVLYLSDTDDSQYCIVDKADWPWISQRLWRLKRSKHYTRGMNGHAKNYVVRSPTNEELTDERHKRSAVFLHKEILRRTKQPEIPEATIGDHVNGDSMNNRRNNLQYATPHENRMNRHGLGIRGRLL